MRRSIRFAAAAVAAVIVLLAPAIWNGFPLLQYDTGGYLAPWYEGTIEISRSTIYGLFLLAGQAFDFWPALIAQALLTVWIAALTLRAHGFGARPGTLLAVIVLLSVATTLPWLASILLTDIFAGLAVLALHLLIHRDDRLRGAERVALVLFIAFAAATHNATLAVLIALAAAALLAALINRAGVPFAGVRRAVAALALGAVMVIGGNLAATGRLTWTPGGASLLFGRMLQSGIAARYLAEHCPDPQTPKLCAHRAELPSDADDFFWGEGIFDRLGRFAGLETEMKTVVFASLKHYPWLHFKAALTGTLQQLALVESGHGVVNWIWHSYDTIKAHVPAAVPDMESARQRSGALGAAQFAVINRVHRPVALVAMLLLLPLLVLGYRSTRFADLGLLAGSVGLALLANAFVCGALVNPHDRYGARLAWMAPLVLLLAIWRWREQPRTLGAVAPAGRQAPADTAPGAISSSGTPALP
jgi:hypothetical protein